MYSIYGQRVANPQAWFDQANELLEAASRLEKDIERFWDAYIRSFADPTVQLPDMDFSGIYFLLTAYAIENLCKGALVRAKVAHYAKQATEKGCLPGELKSHQLWSLVCRTRFSPQEGDEDLLRRLTRCSTWAGRYPAPVQCDGAEEEKYSDGRLHPTNLIGSGDLSSLGDLIHRLKAHVGA